MQLDTTGYYALGIPAYLVVIGAELALTRARGLQTYGFGDTLSNLSSGLGGLLIGLFLAPWLIALYDFAYAHLALVHYPEGSWLRWVVGIVGSDFCYYWYHRAGHRNRVLWAIHGVHHQSERFNVTVAMRQPWFADVYSWPFYALMPLLGVDTTCFFVSVSILSFYALTVHSQVFHRPGLGILVTPMTHIVHHSRNRRYFHRNFGAVFTIWDRMFGTHVDVVPEDPPIPGTPDGYRTHDGVRAQWTGWADVLGIPRDGPARADADIPPGIRAYALTQLVALSLVGTWLLWTRGQRPFACDAVVVLALLAGLTGVGGALDGRPDGLRRDVVRFVATGIAAGIAGLQVPLAGVGLAAIALVGAVGAVGVSDRREPARP
jgi:alkylglycerol monooxygenase